MRGLPELPVSEVLPELAEGLTASGSAVLVAPPGAGKTTIVPLVLLRQPWISSGRIVLVEPRRIAARAAARRMASLIGERTGQTVGFAMRMEKRVSSDTRILVVTEGVFTRMALDDPELTGISAVLFDEFHERSLDGDFGLALALDIASALRPDLKLLVMSATLDAGRVADLLGDAPVIESEGRSFPVTVEYQPRRPGETVENAVARTIRSALAESRGSCLAFLPGQREILRVARLLAGKLTSSVDVIPLHGGLDGKAQDIAIRPAVDGRQKVVLATAIAETSITIDGVNTVIDSGLARVPKFEPATGLTRLETVRVSIASADQRAGRAGRTAPGRAIRLWHEGQTISLPEIAQPEILEADLSGLLLDCAAFGVSDPSMLSLLTPPPKAALTAARRHLVELGALDKHGAITPTGKAVRKLPLPARLASMVLHAANRGQADKAAEISVLLTERGLGGFETDLDGRLGRFRADRGMRAEQAKKLAARLAAATGAKKHGVEVTTARLLLDAYPDRVANARGNIGHFLLANGRGVFVDETDPLARETYLVVADLHGRAQNARITAAAALDPQDIEAHLGHRIERETITSFDRRSGTVRQRQKVLLGAITLNEAALPPPKGEEADQAVVAAIREHGIEILPWSETAVRLRQRLRWLHGRFGDPWPAVDDIALVDRLEEWLQPFLTGEPGLSAIPGQKLMDGLMALVPHDLARKIENVAPSKFNAPTGSRLPINYSADIPSVAIRVQELYGLDAHPFIGSGVVPLILELLSPAGRPIQSTLDLPGFWRGSWADARREMKGRYPKHVWPEAPQNAVPTTRAKPRSK